MGVQDRDWYREEIRKREGLAPESRARSPLRPSHPARRPVKRSALFTYACVALIVAAALSIVKRFVFHG